MRQGKRFRAAAGAAAIVCAAALSLCAAGAVFAQTPPGTDARRGQELSAALSVISSVMRDDPRRAAQMLEALEELHPGEPRILTLLGDAYAVLGEPDRAVAAYSRCLEANPADARAGASLGLLHVRGGDREKGEAVFRALIERTGRSIGTYRTIGATLAAGGYFDLAIRMYDEGRRENKAHYILTLDIAQLHKTMGDLEASLEDYIELIEQSPGHYALSRDRVLELVRDPRADADALTGRLAAAASREGPQRGGLLDLLALAYLECGMIENALETALEAQARGDPDGKTLFNLAEKAASEYRKQPFETRGKYFDAAIRATEAFIDGHPKAPRIPAAKLMLVDLLADLASGRVERRPTPALETATARAIETLDWTIASFPRTDHAETAYLKKGDLVFRLQKRPREAIAVYEEGLSKARIRQAAFAERLGRLYIVVEDYDKAAAYLTRLVNDREPDLRETGVYYVGLLLGVTGRYEAARDTLTALAQGNPSSRFTNDAIALAWAIDEGLQGDQKLLGRYVDALKHKAAEDTAQAIVALGEIAARQVETPLRPRALFELGDLYRGAGAYDEALETYERFLRDYPTHVRVPDARRGVGQVYEHGYRDEKRALEEYEDILLSYPRYIFLDEVRKDVARLRDKPGAKNGSS